MNSTKLKNEEESKFKKIQNHFKEHIKENYSSGKWTKQEDEKLLNLIQDNKPATRWKKIALQFENKSKSQCYSRFIQINPRFNKGKWSNLEEDKLRKLISIHGKKWSFLSKKLVTRSSKQVRDHYNNCMDNTLDKNKFSDEEITQIKKLYLLHGPKWAIIAKHFKGKRTGDSIKNKYYWCISKSLTPEEVELLKSIY
jgi:hypothetical protein